MKMRGSDLVVRALEDAGARFAFGIPGTHNIELYDALHRSQQVLAVLITDEQSAGFMADGVSRTSSSVGVVNFVAGAGVTHGLSGVAEAYLDGIPLVVLACGIRNDTGRAYQLHDIDQLALLRPVTKACLTPASPADIYQVVRQAFDLAQAGTPGPVAVEIPANFYLLTHEVPATPTYEPAVASTSIAAGAVEEAARLLNGATRVMMYLGYGARHAGSALVAIAEALGSPVATTIQGKGVFPEHHPLWLWNGLGRSAPPFVREVASTCEVMLAVGCRFGEVATGSYGFTPPATLIHVDINPDVFHRNFPATLAIEADALAFASTLAAQVVPRGEWGDTIEHMAVGHRDLLETWLRGRSEKRVTPAVLFDALQRVSPDAIYATDSGNGMFLGMEHLRLDAPGQFLAPVDFSCMGYSVPAAIGAKLANPGRDVVAMPGDGALLMTGLELMTAASFRVGVVVCVLRDGELAQIAQLQRTAFGHEETSELPPCKLDALAAAVGAEYLTCQQDSHVAGALGRAFELARAGRTVVVDVAIDYSRKTFFTQGIVATTFWRLPWSDRLRMLARAVSRNFQRLD